MRKIVLMSVFFVNLCAFSQIKVLDTKPFEKLGKLGTNGVDDIYVQKEGDEYTFFYKNIETKESTAYRNFSFKDVNKDYDGLYTIIANGFTANPLRDIKLELPNDYVWLHYTRNTQKVMVQFMTSNITTDVSGISNLMTIDQINKLFSK
jgi:hypothetical protein